MKVTVPAEILVPFALLGIALGWFAIRYGTVAVRHSKDMLGARADADLAQMFVFMGAQRLLYLALLATVSIAAVAWLLGAPVVGILILALVGAWIPRYAVWWMRRKRYRRLCTQLPEALALWAGLLRSGQGVIPALQQVTLRQAAPLGEDLRLLLNQQRVGMPLEVAIQALQVRTGVQDLRMLSTLLHLNKDLGGNLAESLQRLSELLAKRLAMEGRITALTAQGKLQGWVVGALPVLLLVVLYFMEPDAMRALHTTWQGWSAVATMLVLEIVGFLFIRRIVNIDV
jgi:tight adherence protein B